MELIRGTWVDAREASVRLKVSLLPIGSVENHGPHLPLGTDLFTAEHIAREAAKSGDFVLLPAIPVGLSAEHRQFPGTLWVSRRVLMQYVLETIRSLASHGLRRVVLVNGHGGNTDALEDVCRSLREECIYAFVYQWWNAIRETIERVCIGSPDHAGDMETSAVLHIDPERVRGERIAEAESEGATSWGRRVHGVSVGFDAIDFTRSGSTGKPSAATPEKGQRLMDAAISKLKTFGCWLSEQEDEALAARPRVS